MAGKTMNQVLGENLRALMTERGLSANALGPKAGLSPNTVGNYLKAADRDPETMPTTGKERSAKLAEVEMLAAALGVSPLALLTDRAELERQAAAISALVMKAMGAEGPAVVPPLAPESPPSPPQETRPRRRPRGS